MEITDLPAASEKTAYLVHISDILYSPVCRGVPAQGPQKTGHVVWNAELERFGEFQGGCPHAICASLGQV